VGIAFDFLTRGINTDNSLNVLFTEAILIAVFLKAIAGINKEDVFSGICILFVEENKAGRNTGSIEEVRRQTDDAFNINVYLVLGYGWFLLHCHGKEHREANPALSSSETDVIIFEACPLRKSDIL
jgi:hypothetical protein